MWKTFLVPIEKEIRKVDKDSNVDISTVFYKISARFMLWQVHDYILSIIQQKKFKKLNAIAFLNMKVSMTV